MLMLNDTLVIKTSAVLHVCSPYEMASEMAEMNK